MPSRRLLLTFIATLAAYLLAAEHPHRTEISIAATVITLWLTEALPLWVTGLLVPGLILLFGVATVPTVSSWFFHDILLLFGGCFLLAEGLRRHGADKRIALLLLARGPRVRTPLGLTFLLAGVTAFLSMWISNTAVCAMLLPIALGVLSTLDAPPALRVRPLLATAYGASIGGIGTPIGSPPNQIALANLASQGIEVSFLEWMTFGLPGALLLLIALCCILEWCFPVPRVSTEGALERFRSSFASQDSLSQAERRALIVMSCAILGWLLPDLLRAAGFDVITLRPSLVAVIAATLLFIVPAGSSAGALLPLSAWRAIDWRVLALFGGGLTLGSMITSSGLAAEASRYLSAATSGNITLLIIGLIVFALLITEVASNTASAAILVPLAASQIPGVEGAPLVIGVAVATTLGFMLPIATPPNAMVYATGEISAAAMRRAGFWLNIAGVALVSSAVLALR